MRVIRKEYEQRQGDTEKEAPSREENVNPFRAPLETGGTSGDARSKRGPGQNTVFLPYLGLLLSVIVLCTLYRSRLRSFYLSCAEGCLVFFLSWFVSVRSGT